MQIERSSTTHLEPLRADFDVRHVASRVEHIQRARAILLELQPVGLVAAVVVSGDGERGTSLRHRQRLPCRISSSKAGQNHTQERDAPLTEHRYGSRDVAYHLGMDPAEEDGRVDVPWTKSTGGGGGGQGVW